VVFQWLRERTARGAVAAAAPGGPAKEADSSP
jgi:hypothetical protein